MMHTYDFIDPRTSTMLRFGKHEVHSSEHYWSHVIPPITCRDGFTVSVQASKHHYCSPRSDFGPWEDVEVGFPSERPEPWSLWSQFQDSPSTNDPTKDVYARVPMFMVETLLALHGGEDPATTQFRYKEDEV